MENNIYRNLLDESYNKEKVVKSISEIIKNHLASNKPINGKIVSSIIGEINSCEYDGFVNDWSIDDTDRDCLGCFIIDDMFIDINLTNAYNYALLVNKKYNVGNFRLAYYFSILFLIFHEQTHAIQLYLHKNDLCSFYEPFFEIYDKYPFIYADYYSVFLLEHYSELRGYIMAYDILSCVYSEKYLCFIKNMFVSQLLSIYDTTDGIIKCAMDYLDDWINLYNLTPYENDFSTITSLYERMYIGLPISMDEYNRVNQLLKDNNSIEGDIKIYIDNFGDNVFERKLK